MLHRRKQVSQKSSGQATLLIGGLVQLWHKCLGCVVRNWPTFVTGLVCVVLCGLICHMVVSPLCELPAPIFEDEQYIAAAKDLSRSSSSIAAYTQLLKNRNLFKPSVPIPTERKMQKTMAEQLAERLQFLGTSGKEKDVSALIYSAERGPGSYRVGDSLSGFVLKKISEASLVLELDNEQIVLRR